MLEIILTDLRQYYRVVVLDRGSSWYRHDCKRIGKKVGRAVRFMRLQPLSSSISPGFHKWLGQIGILARYSNLTDWVCNWFWNSYIEEICNICWVCSCSSCIFTNRFWLSMQNCQLLLLHIAAYCNVHVFAQSPEID